MRPEVSSAKARASVQSSKDRPRSQTKPLPVEIALVRVYRKPAFKPGARFLVDRVWPRGIKKEDLGSTDWLRDVAPSDGLRKWFGHDPARWEQFRRRYEAELNANPAAWRPILEAAEQGAVTLLFAAKDEAHNQAVVLRQYLMRKLSRMG